MIFRESGKAIDIEKLDVKVTTTVAKKAQIDSTQPDELKEIKERVQEAEKTLDEVRVHFFELEKKQQQGKQPESSK